MSEQKAPESLNTKSTTQNWSLWIGLAIPVLMIVFIALSIYLPRMFDKTPPPSINFLYTSQYSSAGNYHVEKGTVVWEAHENARGKRPALYLYDVKTDTSTELTLDEVKALTVDQNNQAVDGYRVEGSRRNGFFIFDVRSSRRHYLVKGHKYHHLTLNSQQYSYYSMRFIGWDMTSVREGDYE